VTDGKVIRRDEKGYEIFEDFLSESGILGLFIFYGYKIFEDFLSESGILGLFTFV
jgi:hypothetical protein